MKLGKIKEVAVLNPRKFRIFHRHLLKGNIHTEFVTQNVKMTFSVQPTNAPLKTSCVTYYTMKTLFDENRKYCNQKKQNPSPRFTHCTASCFIDRYDGAFEFCSRGF